LSAADQFLLDDIFDEKGLAATGKWLTTNASFEQTRQMMTK